jgi:PAS domain S-box-containing protein
MTVSAITRLLAPEALARHGATLALALAALALADGLMSLGALLQLGPAAGLMAPATALPLLLAAAGLLLSIADRRYPALAAALAASCFVLAASAASVSGELASAVGAEPIRPMTAAALLVETIGLLIFLAPGDRLSDRQRAATAMIAGAIGGVLASLSLFDAAVGLRALSEWWLPESPPLDAALAIGFLGSALIARGYRLAPATPGQLLAGFGIAVVALQVTLTFILWQGLATSNGRVRAEMLATAGRTLGERFTDAFAAQSNALDGMAERWRAAGRSPRDLWTDDARTLLEQLLYLRAIHWLDPSGTPRWSARDPGQTLDRPSDPPPIAEEFLRLARTHRAVVHSDPVLLPGGESGVLLVRALTANGKPDGYLVATLRFDAFAAVVAAPLTPDTGWLIARNGHLLHRRGEAPPPGSSRPVFEQRLFDAGGSWEIELWHADESATPDSGRNLAGLVILGGMALTLLTATLFWLWGRSLRAAEQLRLAATVFENSHEAVTITDPQGQIISVNRAFTAITGYAAREVIGRNPRILSSGRNSRQFYTAMWHTIETEGFWSGEIWNRRKNGDIYPELLSVTRVCDGGGRVSHYIGMFFDISDRKRSEAALQENLRHTQAVLDNVVDGILTIDAEGCVLSFNRAAEAIFGYRAAGIVGHGATNLLPEAPPGEIIAYLRRHLPAEARAPGEGGRETVGRRHDGSCFPMELAVAEISAGGKAVFVALARDITLRKQWERDLVSAKEEAERANLVRSQFLSSMSHELRTPLNAVLGFAQLLDIDPTLGAEARENVGQIAKAGRDLLHLVNEVLKLSQIESGDIDMVPGPVEVGELVADCLGLVAPMARQQQVTLEPLAGGSATVRADRRWLRQVLVNLLSNAIKFNRAGGSVRITITRLGDERVRIAVADTGSGIPLEMQKRLFRPFERLETSPYAVNVEGTGIGLAVCKRLIDEMDGAITVNSIEGSGSTFYLTLPAAIDDAAAFVRRTAERP